jgi:hypothetical protein
MEKVKAIERISDLLGADMTQTTNTSMRIPAALRDAATLAAKELNVAPSATALMTSALESVLEAILMQAVLDAHYERYPDARPDLGDLAVAAAELDGHPMAAEPARIRRAAVEIAVRHPTASPEDVLLWAEARSAGEAA